MCSRLSLLLALLLAQPAKAATDEATLHFAAHFGLSYAINTVGYGLAAKTAKLDRREALILAAAGTLLVGGLRQIVSAGDGSVNANGLWQNALGVAAFTATAVVFEF